MCSESFLIGNLLHDVQRVRDATATKDDNGAFAIRNPLSDRTNKFQSYYRQAVRFRFATTLCSVHSLNLAQLDNMNSPSVQEYGEALSPK